ncbi:protein-tyrosine phosphatase [Desulfonispora thiosulfatigenes DSM 11270]|uniref:protein-tyrosine-phosphatase n=1 Tax=Desulfonispora thiosulfatigenes DSM 11270 TaxID=656914 RepID=A0A1W1V6A0_DESTI|nr:CpsB/CapC family capsule biosynthesis tyrosine phosphatase [Desulfonispora thiosulfatigenes]SMB88937.1 protein-tyrosine phosphatase [Desulfonispora thiosulfatigenes DSM 11270]
MVDLHSHILPEIDDGSKSMEETLKMGRIAASQGFNKIIATPHYIEGEYTITKDKLLETIKRVNACFQKENIKLEVLPGAEVYLSPSLPAKLKAGEISTLNNSPYILIEFPMRDIPVYTEDILYEVRLLGYKPVIAHPERYSKVMEDPNYLKSLIEQGNYVQINSMSITGGLGERVKKTAQILLKHKMVHFIGTDAHSPRARSPKIQGAIEQMKKWTDENYLEKILKNGYNLISGEEIIVLEPLIYQNRNAFLAKFRSIFNIKKRKNIWTSSNRA